jgi:hypothetical protein
MGKKKLVYCKPNLRCLKNSPLVDSLCGSGSSASGAVSIDWSGESGCGAGGAAKWVNDCALGTAATDECITGGAATTTISGCGNGSGDTSNYVKNLDCDTGGGPNVNSGCVTGSGVS